MTSASATYALPYEHVAASQTAQVLGTTGAIGDYLHRLVITVGTAATSTVSLLDNTTSHVLVAANTAIGVYSIEINTFSKNGAWKVTTGAGAEVIAVGNFT
jgi:hypothetical protein